MLLVSDIDPSASPQPLNGHRKITYTPESAKLGNGEAEQVVPVTVRSWELGISDIICHLPEHLISHSVTNGNLSLVS